MSQIRGWAVLLGALAIAAAPAAEAAPKRTKAPKAVVGKPAPEFTVTTFDGQTIRLSDLRGKVVVLNYWATWCAPCRIEMPVMDAWLRKHPGADVEILAITTEGSVPARKLKPLAAALSFPLVARLSGDGYGIVGGAVPSNYVIDRSGVVRFAKAGAFDERSFDALLKKLLAEPASEPEPAPAE